MKLTITNTLFVGKVAKHLHQIDSTNSYAKKMVAKSSPAEGTVIYADIQTQGRGQIGSKWNSAPHKNLIMSVILYPKFLAVGKQFQLNKIVSLAIIDLLQPLLPQQSLKIKWPNDIYVGKQKIAGILIENSLSQQLIKDTVIGIGLNVNQTQFDSRLPNPTSLQLLTGKVYQPTQLLATLCQCLEKRYLQLKAQQQRIDEDYLNYLLGYQSWRLFELPASKRPLKGMITGVSPNGQLEMETEAHPLSFNFKEVRFLFD